MTAGIVWLRLAALAITDQPVLIAAAGIVVVLAVVLVIFMVLRSNGSSGRASNGLGFDPQQGQIGEARGPQSQPSRYAQPSQPNQWGSPQAYAQPTIPGQQPYVTNGNGWGQQSAWQGGAPVGAGAPWPGGGAPSGAGWGDPAAQMPHTSRPLAEANWGAPQPAPAQMGAWGQPPQQPYSTGLPMGQPMPGQAQMGGWGQPQPQQPYNSGMPMMPPGGGMQLPRVGVLTVRKGPVVGQVMELRYDRFGVGRAKENDLVLEDGAVSRHHSVILRDPQSGTYVVRDENSANGTWVNGQKLTSDYPLKEGDEIQIGQILLSFTMR
ncbi:MAG TPA: FHA domain-containing protein [Ktedonobacterales bacterium]